MTRSKLWVGALSGALALSCGGTSKVVSASPESKEPPPAGEPVAPAPVTESPSPQAQDPIAAAVNAADRTAEDRDLDPQRKPLELLRFYGVSPGQRVAELAAGKGYTAELLARIVGPTGTVYGQNSPFILERFAEAPWTERLQKPVMKNVVRLDTEFDAPFPADVTNLDAVFLILFYHDTVWFETDRAKMNAAIFDALRPGGIYAIVDHSAAVGDGVTQAKTLHRIEESILRKEVEAAGFRLDGQSDLLRNPDDPRDWNASPSAAGERRGESDRFVLKFIKPEIAQGSSDGAPLDPEANYTACEEPRGPMCTREYRPVCADIDTGVRCIKAPCPSTKKKTYSNPCMACADEKVVGHVPGACPTP